MKPIELRKMELIPLNEVEKQEINGGFWWIPAALATTLFMSAFNNFGDIREGFSDGWNNKKPRH